MACGTSNKEKADRTLITITDFFTIYRLKWPKKHPFLTNAKKVI